MLQERKKCSHEKRCRRGFGHMKKKGEATPLLQRGVFSPGLPGGPWGRALVRLVSSLPWLPSSKGQTSTLFHLRSCRSQKPFCSGLQWGFSTMHIHRAPAQTHTFTFRDRTLTHFVLLSCVKRLVVMISGGNICTVFVAKIQTTNIVTQLNYHLLKIDVKQS